MKRSVMWLVMWGLVALAGAGCGPTLLVRHQDPTVPAALVRVDGAVVGRVEYGDELEIDVAAGWHQIEAVRASDEADGWWSGPREVVVEDTCTVTLMTPKARRKSTRGVKP